MHQRNSIVKYSFIRFTKVLFLLTICTWLNSPIINAQGFDFGLYLQPGFNWFSAESNSIKGKTRMLFAYGLKIDYMLNDRYGISTGAHLSYAGSSLRYEFPTNNRNDNKTRYKLTLVEVPIAINLRTNELGYMTYFGQIGMQASFIVKARKDVSYDNNPNANVQNVKAEDELAKGNAALLIGFGMEYALAKNTALFAMLYYTNGFVDIVKDEDADKVTLSGISIKMGVSF